MAETIATGVCEPACWPRDVTAAERKTTFRIREFRLANWNNERAARKEFIRAGKLRALAVTTAARSEALPDVPTVSDFLPGFEAIIWSGVGAPKNTPAEIVDKLNREINAALTDPKMKVRFADLGAMALVGSPREFGKLIAEEIEKWAKVVKFSGAKPE